jgi:uncharacterized membrane protein YhiD involved in acid resistance
MLKVIIGILVGIGSLFIGVALILYLILFITKRKRRMQPTTNKGEEMENIPSQSEEQRGEKQTILTNSNQQDSNSVTQTQISSTHSHTLTFHIDFVVNIYTLYVCVSEF